ncbi:MAG: DUF805 domain-containing protein [Sphingomonadaceae bacterium]|nr:DUF805 domain-containing protein [Sphingomonadaceae bacterium]
MLFAALRKYAVFSGRARRKEYWQFILLSVIAGFVAAILDGVTGLNGGAGRGAGVFGSIESLALLIPTLAVGWRRMHDINKPGWFSLIPAILVVGLVLVVSATAGIAAIAVGGFGGVLGLGIISIVFALLILASVIWLFVLTVMPGTSGPNAYGPDPKGVDTSRLSEVFS